MKTIQENLGHHDAAFTLQEYSGVTNKMRQTATDEVGKLLLKCLEG